ncbi:(S)-benzoin forming benzil reductase [Metabacillus malikii]|uniref:Benzil reductase ((S)-benzoin forming) n=1 Tax=Metabacillus malikii TaxID=1504265 RepID=A0ABT9ZCL6_9BACI|nr:(S)-benzoin forming benzil reductase [Metabacillus malikii]MDQ0229755.1 benzil reductase ((S)-benzoin forming) [Metabacillus malikii]
MNYYIVTGASKGLGEAIVKELFHRDSSIIYLSRNKNTLLEKLADNHGVTIVHQQCDLSNVETIKATAVKVFSLIDMNQAHSITLINNAGMVEPIKHVGDANEQEIVEHVNLNLISPMLLCEFFIKEYNQFQGQVRIVNITSGSANRPTAGWSTYCSTKSGLNMFTNTIAIEQHDKENPIIAIGFSPGIMDTDMQSTLRTAKDTDFPSIDQFKAYHEKGMLRSPSFVANTLVTLLTQPLENGRIYDIKEFI